eukprot:TRINITY_DN31727_c0_g1_i1.p2 TRINITY_DN31727_c0_g1~~TRINITY_DN31727_c0_g1_i1.p2  ORF type:complete len:141 (-),score=25.78 TRINITY_DN31727_c0_g1_i1:59-481(-)
MAAPRSPPLTAPAPSTSRSRSPLAARAPSPAELLKGTFCDRDDASDEDGSDDESELARQTKLNTARNRAGNNERTVVAADAVKRKASDASLDDVHGDVYVASPAKRRRGAFGRAVGGRVWFNDNIDEIDPDPALTADGAS